MLRPPLLLAAAHLLALSACATTPRERPLQPFESEQEWAEHEARRRQEAERLSRQAPPPRMTIEPPSYYNPPPPPLPGAPVPPPPPPGPARTVVEPAAEADPGPLVRVHGAFLVMLHRGRLFSVRVAGGALEPVSVVDAFGPGTNPLFSDYDDLLVAGDRVVAVSLESSSGGVRLEVFRLAPDGALAHRATYSLASAGEHFNGIRQHASRMVGGRLVFYSGVDLHYHSREASSYNDLPTLRRWGHAARVPPAAPTRIYRPAAGHPGTTMHTVTSCALEEDDLRCRSTALYAASSERFYVSSTAVYLWASHNERYWEEGSVPRFVLYRFPLDGSAPTALRVAGRPLNAFSFHESADGHINVLVQKDASGAAVWGAERGLALLRVPLAELGDGSRAAAAAHYRPLPGSPAGGFHHRFAGDWLVYGTGAWALMGRPGPDSATAYAVHVAGGEVAAIAVPHGIDRIDAMGSHAVILGGRGADLHLTTLRLDSAGAAAAAHHTLSGPAAGVRIARGAFALGADVLGIPLLGGAGPGAALPDAGSARIVFLRDGGARLEPLGEVASADPARDDACPAGCVPWFGNAQPLRVGGRILALMGYELVEASVADGRLRELRRVELTPRPPIETLSGDWEFTETLGPVVGSYRCSNTGTMRLEREGAALTVRYRQTGECTVDGVTTPTDGEGGGTGSIEGDRFTLMVNGCTYHGRMQGASALTARVFCPVPQPSAAPWTAEGHLEARRTQP